MARPSEATPSPTEPARGDDSSTKSRVLLAMSDNGPQMSRRHHPRVPRPLLHRGPLVRAGPAAPDGPSMDLRPCSATSKPNGPTSRRSPTPTRCEQSSTSPDTTTTPAACTPPSATSPPTTNDQGRGNTIAPGPPRRPQPGPPHPHRLPSQQQTQPAMNTPAQRGAIKPPKRTFTQKHLTWLRLRSPINKASTIDRAPPRPVAAPAARPSAASNVHIAREIYRAAHPPAPSPPRSRPAPTPQLNTASPSTPQHQALHSPHHHASQHSNEASTTTATSAERLPTTPRPNPRLDKHRSDHSRHHHRNLVRRDPRTGTTPTGPQTAESREPTTCSKSCDAPPTASPTPPTSKPRGILVT